MKRSTLLLTATAFTAALLVSLSTPNADAQRRQRGLNGTNGGQANGANGQFQGNFGQFRGQNSQFVDPLQNSIMTLLKRDDVKSEIMLSQRQGEEMTAEETKDQTDLVAKVQAARGDRSALQGLSGDERRQKQQEMRQKQQEARDAATTAMNEDLDKKAQEVLKPEQVKRLKELDLQWRGGLALADPKVSEQFKLTAEQKTQIATILADFKKTQQDTMRAAMPTMGGRTRGNRNNGANGAPGATPAPGAPGADPNAAGTPQTTPAPQAAPDPAAIQAKMKEARDTVEKARLEANTKALAVLTADQKAAWTTAQGRKFTFRKADSQVAP